MQPARIDPAQEDAVRGMGLYISLWKKRILLIPPLALVLRAYIRSYLTSQFRLAIPPPCRTTIYNMPSFFSYDITRNYKPAWVTPVVLIGGVFATALFSFLNLATSGYSLVATYSTNPNQTISHNTTALFQNWPSFMVQNTRATCGSATLPVNAAFFTNNTALTYTLTGISQEEAAYVGPLGSFGYLNNPLENCTIDNIMIWLEGTERTASQVASQQWGVDMTASITCSIKVSTGVVQMNMNTQYNRVPSLLGYSTSCSYFIGRSRSDRASLYWGESLLAMYWIQLTNNMYLVNLKGENKFNKGHIDFKPNTSEGIDMTSLDFLKVDGCFFLPFLPYPPENLLVGFCQTKSVANLSTAQLLPDIWIPADSLAKSLYSTILTDLGQMHSSSPNILVEPRLLEYFTRNFSYIGKNNPAYDNVVPDVFLASESYDPSNATEQLGAPLSTFSTSYLCSVPQLKSTSSLFMAILIADLVFLQALWRLSKLCMDFFMSGKDPEMMYCSGCLQIRAEDWSGEKPSDRMLGPGRRSESMGDGHE